MIFPHFGPGLLWWTPERSGLAREDFAGKFNTLPEWGEDEARSTLKQIEAFCPRRVRMCRLQRHLDSRHALASGQIGEKATPPVGTMEAMCRSAEATDRAATTRHLDRERRKLKIR